MDMFGRILDLRHPLEMQSTLSPATTQLAARRGASRPQSRRGPLRVSALAIPNDYGYDEHAWCLQPRRTTRLNCAAGCRRRRRSSAARRTHTLLLLCSASLQVGDGLGRLRGWHDSVEGHQGRTCPQGVRRQVSAGG